MVKKHKSRDFLLAHESSNTNSDVSLDQKIIYKDIHEKLLDDRVVFLTGEIDQAVSEKVISELIYLNSKGNKKITMYINSPGGDIDALLAIYNIMNVVSSPISTVCLFEAASSAAILLCAGSKGLRYATSNSSIMIHQMWIDGSDGGTVTQVETEAKALKQLKKKLTEILARHCGQPYKKVLDDCETDTYFTAVQAKVYGLIDKVIYPSKTIPKLVKSKKKSI